MTVYVGCDISLNHGAIVVLAGDKVHAHYYTDKKTKAVSFDNVSGTHLPVLKTEDSDLKSVERLVWISNWLDSTGDLSIGYYAPPADTFAGIEGYAFSKNQGAHQLGEVGGIARMWLRAVAPYRIHDPSSIKMFACGKGNADKDQVIDGCRRQWSYPTQEMVDKLAAVNVEDIADAFAVAKMVEMEHRLRTGQLVQAQLSEDQLRVFNRVTDSNPVNLLGRDWITNGPRGA